MEIKVYQFNPDFQEWEVYHWTFKRWRHIFVWVRPNNPNTPRPGREVLKRIIAALVEYDDRLTF